VPFSRSVSIFFSSACTCAENFRILLAV
jgi:hypothetical protein